MADPDAAGTGSGDTQPDQAALAELAERLSGYARDGETEHLVAYLDAGRRWNCLMLAVIPC